MNEINDCMVFITCYVCHLIKVSQPYPHNITIPTYIITEKLRDGYTCVLSFVAAESTWQHSIGQSCRSTQSLEASKYWEFHSQEHMLCKFYPARLLFLHVTKSSSQARPQTLHQGARWGRSPSFGQILRLLYFLLYMSSNEQKVCGKPHVYDIKNSDSLHGRIHQRFLNPSAHMVYDWFSD